MFGKVLSGAIKVITSPIDVVESAADVVTGGDGSKRSKKQADNFMSEIRDGICKGLEDMDKQ